MECLEAPCFAAISSEVDVGAAPENVPIWPTGDMVRMPDFDFSLRHAMGAQKSPFLKAREFVKDMIKSVT